MLNELRYQAKIHAISDMPRKGKKKIPCIFSPDYFFFIFFIIKNSKNML
jgi:hypothetical protein